MSARSNEALLAAVLARLDTAEARIAAQEAEIAVLRRADPDARPSTSASTSTSVSASTSASASASASGEVSTAGADRGETPDRTTPDPLVHDRRVLLRRAGLVAAGALGGGAALAAGAGPAAAATGDSVVAGSGANTANAATVLSWNGATQTSTGPAVLLVKDSTAAQWVNSGGTITGYRATEGGSAVRGVHTGAAGTGVAGQGDFAGGTFVGTASTYGVVAQGGTAVSVDAMFGGGVGLDVSAGGVHLLLRNGVANPTTGAAPRLAGSLARDLDGTLWLCTASGTPGTWREVAGPSSAGALHVLPKPVRVFDSRPGFPPAGAVKGTFVDQTKPIATTANGSGVPVGATAVLVNLAVTETVGGGYAALWRQGLADPGTANLNWSGSGTTISNTVVSAVDAAAAVSCKVAGTAHVIVDVVGYWR